MSDSEPRTIERMFSELRELARTKRCGNCGGSGRALYNPAPFGFNPGNRMYEDRCAWCGGSGRERR
jgi:hypothetical protein